MNLYKLHSFICSELSIIRVAFFNSCPNITIGKGTYIDKGVTIKVQGNEHVVIGKNCHISKGAQLLTNGGNIEIGNDSTINPYTIIYGSGNTSIGNGVRIAAHCTIVSANHVFSAIDKPIYKQGFTTKGIVIEDDVWLGSGVKVLDGVRIRRGCVIGANAVVTHSTEEYGVYLGVPAQKFKSRL